MTGTCQKYSFFIFASCEPLNLKPGSREQIIAEIGVSGAEIEQKLGLKMQNVSKIEVRFLKLERGLKWWVSRAKKWPEKGSLEGGTSPYYLPM